MSIVVCMVSTDGLNNHARGQQSLSIDAVAPTDQELLRRLEATESELRYLRTRGQQRTEWRQSVGEQLTVVPASHTAVDAPTTFASYNVPSSASPWEIVPFGFLTGEAIAAETSTRSRPFILYLTEGRAAADQFTVHGQTTALGLKFSGPYVGSLQLGGMILFNFLGDRPALNQSTPFFLRGYGELKNEYWRFTFGQQGDLFSPINPVTVNFGGHKQAGNGGAFRGSIRAERFIHVSDNVQWKLQSAISQQVITDFVVNPSVIGEDNGWPNVEGRIGLGFGPTAGCARLVEVGVSGVIGEVREISLTKENVYTSWGLSADAQYKTERSGLGGEFFVGQALGTYNLGIGQSINPTDSEAIRTIGGWSDIWYKLTPCLTMHVGYGIDNPRNGDLGTFTAGPLTIGQRSRNQVIWANLIWDVSKHFDMAFEVSHRETDYIAPSVSNNGMIYHFRSRIKF